MYGSIPGVAFASIHDGLSNTLFLGERPEPHNLVSGVMYARNFGDYSESLSIVPALIPAPPGYTNPCATTNNDFHRGDINDPCTVMRFWSFHPIGANFAMCDTSVRFLKYGSTGLLAALASHANGEPIDFD